MATFTTDRAREVLLASRADGNKIYLPPGQLPREVYEEVNRVLVEAGGKWKGGKVRAHVFEAEAAPTLAQILQAARFVSTKEVEQWFPSPPEVAQRLVAAGLLAPGMTVLEPSAGKGALAALIAQAGCAVDCVEINPERAAFLQEAGYARKVITGDFLGLHPYMAPLPDLYDAVIMNPPFAGHADEHHIVHALGFVRPGGVLVALMGAGIRHRTNHDARLIKNLAGGAIDDVPGEAFKSVGAELPTCIVVIRTGGQRLSGERIRVSLHGPDPVLPQFSLALAPRGLYEARDAGSGEWRRFRWYGDCIGCGGRTWNWDDQIGVSFGDHSYLPFTASEFTGRRFEQACELPDQDRVWNTEWPECMGCQNNRARHDRSVSAAWASLQPPVDDRGDAVLF